MSNDTTTEQNNQNPSATTTPAPTTLEQIEAGLEAGTVPRRSWVAQLFEEKYASCTHCRGKQWVDERPCPLCEGAWGDASCPGCGGHGFTGEMCECHPGHPSRHEKKE